jgi:hypothetical protein
LLLNGHGDKNKQGSPNRIIRAALKGDATGDDDMRDIRNDLQERADLIHDRIKAAAVHFERMVEQLRNEHDARVADSKACLVAKLMEFEERHLANMSRRRHRRRRLPNMLISRKNLEGWCSGGSLINGSLINGKR